MNVLEFLDVLGKNINKRLGYTGEGNSFDIAFFNGEVDFSLEPAGKSVVGEVAHRDIGAVRQGKGSLISNNGPVTCGDQGGYCPQIGVCLCRNGFVELELFSSGISATTSDKLQRKRHKK